MQKQQKLEEKVTATETTATKLSRGPWHLVCQCLTVVEHLKLMHVSKTLEDYCDDTASWGQRMDIYIKDKKSATSLELFLKKRRSRPLPSHLKIVGDLFFSRLYRENNDVYLWAINILGPQVRSLHLSRIMFTERLSKDMWSRVTDCTDLVLERCHDKLPNLQSPLQKLTLIDSLESLFDRIREGYQYKSVTALDIRQPTSQYEAFETIGLHRIFPSLDQLSLSVHVSGLPLMDKLKALNGCEDKLRQLSFVACTNLGVDTLGGLLGCRDRACARNWPTYFQEQKQNPTVWTKLEVLGLQYMTHADLVAPDFLPAKCFPSLTTLNCQGTWHPRDIHRAFWSFSDNRWTCPDTLKYIWVDVDEDIKKSNKLRRYERMDPLVDTNQRRFAINSTHFVDRFDDNWQHDPKSDGVWVNKDVVYNDDPQFDDDLVRWLQMGGH